MKTQISPVVAAVILLVVLAAVGTFLYLRASGGAPKYGAEIPPEVMKEFKEKGPRPMPPIPMPGGGTFSGPGAAQAGPPDGK
jgi:hypothetical protein